MNSASIRNSELGEAKARKAAEVERRKAAARRAYEGGEMTVKEIARVVHADARTVEQWAKAGGWNREA